MTRATFTFRDDGLHADNFQYAADIVLSAEDGGLVIGAGGHGRDGFRLNRREAGELGAAIAAAIGGREAIPVSGGLWRISSEAAGVSGAGNSRLDVWMSPRSLRIETQGGSGLEVAIPSRSANKVLAGITSLFGGAGDALVTGFPDSPL
jgi:hypothetical protein